MKPARRPARPFFSSGPCAKRPGWSVEALESACVGRSHRSKLGKARIAEALERSRSLLDIPDDYRIGMVPASDTGAVEMALWSLLGPRGVDVLAWESFSEGWITDVVQQLKIADVRVYQADYGELPALDLVDGERDTVFVWNGTTSGVKLPNADWISAERSGLTICDATSAVFAMELPWDKLDVTTYSWQKVMGGEAAHGMLVLSPRAVQRLESYTPAHPIPKVFRLTKNGKLNEDVFVGGAINTPSMLCVEDYLDALQWADSIGGRAALIDRSNRNLAVITQWVDATEWVGFLARNPQWRSNTSVCLRITSLKFNALAESEQRSKIKALVELLEHEGVGYDINAYRAAPPGLRIWGGATVDAEDIQALLPWLEWAYQQVV